MEIEELFYIPGQELTLYYNGRQIPIIIVKSKLCSKEKGKGDRIYCESKMTNIENFL